MLASEIIDLARAAYLDDAAIDPSTGEAAQRLWTDAVLLWHLNEAEREAANRALLIRDSSTTDICAIPLVAGQA